MTGRKVGLLAAAATLAVAGGIRLAGRGQPPTLVSWSMTRRLAMNLANAHVEPAPSPELIAIYADLVECSYAAVGKYIEFPTPPDTDAFRVLRREDWINANLSNFHRILKPVIQAYDHAQIAGGLGSQVLGTATRYGVSTQIGVLLGFLGRRVLGQYDIPLLDPDGGQAQIYFIDANLRAVANRAAVPIDGLRFWVTLHEVTHAFQFHAGDPPWLHRYTSDLLTEYLEEAIEMLRRSNALRARLRAAMHGIQRGRLNDGDLLRVALSPKQMQTLEKIQALMTVMEGYSNHVMNAVGAHMIPGYEHLQKRMHAREQSRSTSVRVLTRLLGLDMKLEQYRIGEAFVNEVVDQRGLRFVNKLWEGPAHLPSLPETRDPAGWIARLESSAPKASKTPG